MLVMASRRREQATTTTTTTFSTLKSCMARLVERVVVVVEAAEVFTASKLSEAFGRGVKLRRRKRRRGGRERVGKKRGVSKEMPLSCEKN